jgi:recombination protein RecR
MVSTYPSKLLESAVNELAKLPGIGRKTALRLALHLLKQDPGDVTAFGSAIIKLREEVIYCKECHNISDSEVCPICSSSRRDHATLCVVDNIRDVLAIENTGQYNGVYHILGGIISPIEGVGPEDLNIESLVRRVRSGQVHEVILALPTTIEGDTTNYFIYKQLRDAGCQVTLIARGISVGDELEYTDEITLGRSILNRTPFEAHLSGK